MEYNVFMNTKVALVHDFLIRKGGAERVLKALAEMFPEAPIYTFLYDEKKVGDDFPAERVRTSFLQKFPGFLRKRQRFLLPFLPIAPETFDLREFDLVISSSSAFAKGIITKPKTIHVCYCHSPMRYGWDWYHEYIQETFSGSFAKFAKWPAKLLMHYMRIWDRHASDRVEYFIANSQTTARRIAKYYRRDAKIIYPPVNITLEDEGARRAQNSITYNLKPKTYFLIVSQLIPYKKIDIAVEAFNKLGFPLIIIGEGKQRKELEKAAKSNVKFLGWQADEVVKEYYRNCLAFVFPGEEDFGITAIEAMSFGKPVLAFRKGGLTETVEEGLTGEFFDDPEPEILADGVRRIRENLNRYDPEHIRDQAKKFSEKRFKSEIKDFVQKLKP
ncbi:MAG: Glycosyl transferase group 1 [Candidatus Azambacteria bacterium GW2011_GWA2_45_90]|uniref:Glycosyl transferase group 1 n=1 Tax=Candidatus Azambacteria bacterium GW2011_GWA2_45_90 TaxID=1618614 RepID=A0A0G1NGC5_9BACT|nr:MAG: Glycosyl transferase group 1 [Candidatus Azambacteria bacterium GW2011_GWA2_45_90]